MPERWQGSREGPPSGSRGEGPAQRSQGQSPGPSGRRRASAGQVLASAGTEPCRPPSFLLAHLCLLSLRHSLSLACFLHNRMADAVAAAGRLVTENTEMP